MMWFVLATKMAVTALFVTAATSIAERLGATVGALVATLPVSAGPVYVFLALDHDSTFISSSAVASLALNSATAIYLTAYVLIAQRRSMWLSISLAFVMWLAAVLVLGPVPGPHGRHLFSTSSYSPLVPSSSSHFASYACHEPHDPGTTWCYGGFGGFAGRRGRNSKLSNWPDGKRRACCVPGHLHQHDAHSASPRWRSCRGSRVGERRSRSCRIWLGFAHLASRRSAAWIRCSPHRRPRRFRRLECRCLCNTSLPSCRLMTSAAARQHFRRSRSESRDIEPDFMSTRLGAGAKAAGPPSHYNSNWVRRGRDGRRTIRHHRPRITWNNVQIGDIAINVFEVRWGYALPPLR